MTRIGIIDYGMGNLHAMARALTHVAGGQRVFISYDPAELARADRLVLTGVGRVRPCVDELRRLGLDDLLRETLAGGKPLLAVCLGMQALFGAIESPDNSTGLDLLAGSVRRLPSSDGQGHRLKVPHMGWNQVHATGPHVLWSGIPEGSDFYFVHGYYVHPQDPALIAARTGYGIDFASVIARGALFGVQFHPEKSQHAGLALLANFAHWDGGESVRR